MSPFSVAPAELAKAQVELPDAEAAAKITESEVDAFAAWTQQLIGRAQGLFVRVGV
ncbi:MAG: hypothetical protein AAB834_03600 [Patescibacteria group bacterium]